jgi:Nucleotidyltransferase
MNANPDVEHFARLIDTLHPWLDEVVIIGGWGHRLYRLHALAQPLDYEPLGTLDTDVAVPAQLPANGEDIRQRLLENGFREELLGSMEPPAAHYHVASGDSGFYAEFLTPLVGSEIKRGGKRDVTAQIAGVLVQKLRHLELLLNAPWEVVVAPPLVIPPLAHDGFMFRMRRLFWRRRSSSTTDGIVPTKPKTSSISTTPSRLSAGTCP